MNFEWDNNKDIDEMRSEYKREDLGKGVRGKFLDEYEESHNLVLLKPEIAKVFPTEESVNAALMSLIKLAKASVEMTKDVI